MAKGDKKGQGCQKNNQKQKQKVDVEKKKVANKPQSRDARKMKDVNDLLEVAALSWTSEEEEDIEAHLID